MKLQQLRYIVEVVNNDFKRLNDSRAFIYLSAGDQ